MLRGDGMMNANELFDQYSGQAESDSFQNSSHVDGHADHGDSDSTPGYFHTDSHMDLFGDS
jgi:hypothetical protein